MFSLNGVSILVKDAILSVTDDRQQWHPICAVAMQICRGEAFTISLEPTYAQGYSYEIHKYDNCRVEVNHITAPLERVCFILGIPLPEINDKEGLVDCTEMRKAIVAKYLNLEYIDYSDLQEVDKSSEA